MSSSVPCTDPKTVCTGTIDGAQTPSDPSTTFQCPAGSFITKVSLTPQPAYGGIVAILNEVTCSNGTVLTECAGGCLPIPPAGGILQVADCSSSNPPGLSGFKGRAGSLYNFLSPICNDGATVPLVGFSTGGADIDPPAVCPVSTHRLTKIEMSTGGGNGDVITTGKVTCTPLNILCQGELLQTPECRAYCNTYGGCDSNLTTFCSDPSRWDLKICGCALPTSQYAILNTRDEAGVSPPLSCDRRCQDPGAIRLANTGTCSVNTLCIQSGTNITVLQSQVGKNISVSSSCGNTTTGGGATSSPLAFLTSTAGLIIIGVVLFVIILVIVLLVSSRNRARRKAEEDKKAQVEQQRVLERQQIRSSAPAKRPSVVRIG